MHQKESQGKWKHIKVNENENTFKCNKNLLGSAKAMLRGKFIALNIYIRKEKKSQIF